MLSREVMGLLALGILWVNTLLVVGAAGGELSRLLRLWRFVRPLDLGAPGVGARRGRVDSGLGPSGQLAEHRVEQVGRQAADDHDRPAIAFSDRSYAGTCFGGAVEADGATLHLEAGLEAEIWPDPSAMRASAAKVTAFDHAYQQARKAKGYVRTVTSELGAGAHVWVAGDVATRGERRVLQSASVGGTRRVVVSAIDPRAWCSRKIALLGVFVLGTLLVAAGATAVALWPPHFGVVSTVGGALCLAYFLLIQPLGTAVRDAVRPPSRAILRGSWVGSTKPDADGALVAAPPRR